MMNTPGPADLSALIGSRPRQAPLVTGLLLINMAVFALMLVSGAGLWHSSNSVPLAWGANFGPATQDGQWWRLLTALFVHFGLVHLALNMWALWDVGRLVERLYGRWQFVLLYLGSGVAGNLLSLVVQGNQAVSGGASGAIFSLYGALIVFLGRERRQVDRREFRWLLGAALVFTLLTLGMGQVVPGIDNAAHLGGLIAGALWGTVLARRRTAGSPAPRRWLAGMVLAVGLVTLVTRIPAPSYLLGDELRAREAIRQFLAADQRISQHWRLLFAKGRRPGVTVEELAGNKAATALYLHSVEQLMAARPGAAAPSAQTLDALQRYATVRAQASREVADGLRSHDPGKVLNALVKAGQAKPASPGASAPLSPLPAKQGS